MKKLTILLPFLLLIHLGYSQKTYWQQQVNYFIDVSLNDKEKTLDGFEKIEYTNHSPDTLHFIWFHLWPNAYKNDKTALSEQLLENGNTSFYFSGKEERGYINRLDFKVNAITAATEDHPRYIDIIKLILPAPLVPGQTITITTPFHVKLPYNFSRGGYDGESFQVTQWYPKPAVYDNNGWHPMPYLDQGEFYSEFGSFDVNITLPDNYAVAATGELQNAYELAWLTGRKNFSWRPVVKKIKQKSGAVKKTIQAFPVSSNKTKTLRYVQNNVHDFAWFADKRFIVATDTCKLQSGKIIRVFAYYTPAQAVYWQKCISFCKDAIRFYSSHVGEYAYSSVSVVQGPQSFGGGMEYPTITVISPITSDKELDQVIAHELGHNWFYGMLASDERTHPWMDEGINSFYEQQYIKEKYRDSLQAEKLLFETKAVTKTDQPIETPSEKFSAANYELVAYYKTAQWVSWLRSTLGKSVFEKAMHNYFSDWQFKHPSPADFKQSIENSSGQKLDTVFSYLGKNGLLPAELKKGTDVGFIFQKSHFNRLVQGAGMRKRNSITISPALGFNSYDKLMVGGFVTNYQLPPSAFQFFLSPLYATGSKNPAGTGRLNYTFYPAGSFRKVTLFLNGSVFTQNEYTDSAGKKTFLQFNKLVPGLRLTFKESNPRSNAYRYLQWKTFFIGEDGLQFGRDTVISNNDTSIVNSYQKNASHSVLNQFRFVVENNRALYPYNGELKIEQSKDFIRAAFTGNYYFNYVNHGGLNVRLFAGKFIYLGDKTITKEFSTDRYHLNMTGANGYEDYTYSDYFIGRNKFDGLASQQIMMRDGGFKIRTDLLAEKVGKTDDWLIAANFSSTIPPNINPLRLLPVDIPLKIFADIGTYAETWKKNTNTDHFLYDAGLQVSLFKETLNIYLPLIYSKVYKDYVKTVLPRKGRIWKTMSFTIDIANFSFRKIDRNITF